jgi:2-hydroxychromene-2-carboxylate isomerase
MSRPVFYYDVSSVYGYMAAERIDALLPDADWRPIFFGGLLHLNGRDSWFLSDERESRMAEIEERAARYELPPITWPEGMWADLLGLARAATVAKREGRVKELTLAGMRAIWAEGRDPSTPDGLRRLASAAGLDPQALLAGIRHQGVKDELRHHTEEAHARGVPGVPTVLVGDAVFWGDDRLEEAARAVAA